MRFRANRLFRIVLVVGLLVRLRRLTWEVLMLMNVLWRLRLVLLLKLYYGLRVVLLFRVFRRLRCGF